jgi:hypothetical protein
VSGAVVRPGWQYQAGVYRANALVANPSGSKEVFPLLLGGLPLHVDPLRWKFSAAEAIVASWSNVLVGLRKDVTLEMFNSGVISDDAGVVVLNLLSQNAWACRATCRLGYYLAAPPTDTDPADVGLTALCPVSIVAPYVAPVGP